MPLAAPRRRRRRRHARATRHPVFVRGEIDCTSFLLLRDLPFRSPMYSKCSVDARLEGTIDCTIDPDDLLF
jgi:hypothetical protein